jgi:hypothetical protein
VRENLQSHPVLANYFPELEKLIGAFPIGLAVAFSVASSSAAYSIFRDRQDANAELDILARYSAQVTSSPRAEMFSPPARC